MIIENYSTFRVLANPGGAIGVDGLTEFDPMNMRKNGFDGGIKFSSSIGNSPIVLTCNDETPDAVAGVDEFDWYVSQRTSVQANKPLTVDRFDDLPTNSWSGRIRLDLRAWAAIEYPDPYELETVKVLFFAIDVYAIRRSDGAIQRIDLMKYLVDALSPSTNLE